MLNAKDLEQLSAKGISKEKIEEQLACFEKGFPFLEIEASASEDGHERNGRRACGDTCKNQIGKRRIDGSVGYSMQKVVTE